MSQVYLIKVVSPEARFITSLSGATATGAIAGAYTAICIGGAKTTWCTSLRLGRNLLNGKSAKLKPRISMTIYYLWIAVS